MCQPLGQYNCSGFNNRDKPISLLKMLASITILFPGFPEVRTCVTPVRTEYLRKCRKKRIFIDEKGL